MTSLVTTAAMTLQKSPALALLLSIFLTLLAGDAQARVRQRVEAVEVDVLPATVALDERLRRAVHATERFIDVPEEAAFLVCEEKCHILLHGVGALVWRVERVRANVSVRGLR